MNPTPTGTLTPNDDGSAELAITRLFPGATVEDVWASITEPERTARWYGAWRGEPGIGKSIETQMAFEEGQPWSSMRIDACDPPRVLALSSETPYGNFYLELRVRAIESGAALDFVQHKLDPGMAESVGPGWEYYLDNLVAARTNQPMPNFEDYYPSQSDYFKAQLGD